MVFGPWSEASFVCVCVLHTKGMLRSDFSVWPLYTLVKRCCFLNFTSFSGPSIKCRQWGLWALCFRGQDQGVHGTKHMCPFRAHSPNPKPCSRYLGPETSSPKTWIISGPAQPPTREDPESRQCSPYAQPRVKQWPRAGCLWEKKRADRRSLDMEIQVRECPEQKMGRKEEIGRGRVRLGRWSPFILLPHILRMNCMFGGDCLYHLLKRKAS